MASEEESPSNTAVVCGETEEDRKYAFNMLWAKIIRFSEQNKL